MLRKLLYIFLLFPALGIAQSQLFEINPSASVIATKNADNTLGLSLKGLVYSQLLENRPEAFEIRLPFFGEELTLELQQFQVFNEQLEVTSKENGVDQTLFIKPNLLSYKVFHNNKYIGVFNFVNDAVLGTFQFNNKQYELTLFNGEYVLFEASNSINSSGFSCNVVDKPLAGGSPSIAATPLANEVCIEFVVEIDNYTRETFNSDQEVINWATAIFSGVSMLYQEQTDAAMTIIDFVIWNSPDPYEDFFATEDVLYQLQDYWIANNSGVDRDLVHLMSKRDLGGGIAFLDALCWDDWGFGFSANLDNTTSFDFPNPTYTWNLGCVAHEVGHNIGSEHTHNCNWNSDITLAFDGGAIDNCVDVEGNCPNNPQSQIGTIMSYCHLNWDGGIILEFHPVVLSQAINPGIQNATCLSACALPSWDCVDGGCVERTDGSGEYSSIDDCLNTCVCTANEVTLNFLPDCYGEETAWELSNESGVVLFSVSEYPGGGSAETMEPNPELDQHTWCLQDGCYTFTVSDAYGDGMYGSNPDYECGQDGDYTIFWDGQALATLQNADFGNSDANEFCVENLNLPTWDCNNNACVELGDGSGAYASLADCQSNCHTASVEDDQLHVFKLFPNPTTGIVALVFAEKIAQSLSVINVLGEEVYQLDKIADLALQLDLSNEPKGAYFLQIITEEGEINKMILLQ